MAYTMPGISSVVRVLAAVLGCLDCVDGMTLHLVVVLLLVVGVVTLCCVLAGGAEVGFYSASVADALRLAVAVSLRDDFFLFGILRSY